MLLTKEQILAQRLPSERVDIPWIQDAQIIVRALPQPLTEIASNHEHWKGFVFVNAVVDEAGARLYSDDDAKKVVDTLDQSLIDLVVSKAYALAVIPDDRKEAIKKNWQTLLTATSGESPSPSDTPTQP